MSANAFRSTLMQQFAATARCQSRPPLALMGWLSDDDVQSGPSKLNRKKSDQRGGTSPPRTASPMSPADGASISSIGTTPVSSTYKQQQQSPPSNSSRSSKLTRPTPHHLSVEQRLLSTQTSTSVECSNEETSYQQDTAAAVEKAELAQAFQHLLQTRRTNTLFAPLTSLPFQGTTTAAACDSNDSFSYWNDALERAARCGYAAPNHKRTEPFTLKRMIAPSDKTRRLADIAYHVKLRKDEAAAAAAAAARDDSAVIPDGITRAAAERKRTKWNQIPAFLVAVVTSEQEQVAILDKDDDSLLTDDVSSCYDLLPYVPPQTERELEDYASACCAVQNCLLSLHSEGIASKWATGPVLRTRAFRVLVDATPHDRIVALIMIGKNNTEEHVYRRHRRRQLNGDVLVDL